MDFNLLFGKYQSLLGKKNKEKIDTFPCHCFYLPISISNICKNMCKLM